MASRKKAEAVEQALIDNTKIVSDHADAVTAEAGDLYDFASRSMIIGAVRRYPGRPRPRLLRLAEGHRAADPPHGRLPARPLPTAISRPSSSAPSARTRSATSRATTQVFKENMVKARDLAAEQEALKRQAAEDQQRAMNKMADEFEASVSGIVGTVSSSATELEKSAQGMSATAEQTNRQSTARRGRRRTGHRQRPDRGGGDRGTVLLDHRDRPPGGGNRRRWPARRSTRPRAPTQW